MDKVLHVLKYVIIVLIFFVVVMPLQIIWFLVFFIAKAFKKPINIMGPIEYYGYKVGQLLRGEDLF